MFWIIIILLLTILVLTIGLDVKLKNISKIKEVGSNKELKNITDKFPENEDICKDILKILNNNSVEIESVENTTTSLFLIMQNKIIIGNIKDSCMRIQTIAHECIHSVQNKKILKFNFIYSNFYLLFFFVICILSIFKIVDKNIMYLFFIIQIFSGFIYFVIRSFLEIDAMTRAPYLAQKYIEENSSINKYEEEQLINEYEKINKIGIKLYIYILALKMIVKLLIYSLIICIC